MIITHVHGLGYCRHGYYNPCHYRGNLITGVNPLAISLIVFSVVNLHYILPFHNLAILVGSDPETGGGYTQKDVMKLGIALTAVMLLLRW